MGFWVPDKVAKNRTALQRLMVGLAVRSSRADKKEANSKSATGSTSSWRRRANDAHFAKYPACLLMELCFHASPQAKSALQPAASADIRSILHKHGLSVIWHL